jgi:hypothetical protein
MHRYVIYQEAEQILTQQCSAVRCCCCWFVVFVGRNIIYSACTRRGYTRDLPSSSANSHTEQHCSHSAEQFWLLLFHNIVWLAVHRISVYVPEDVYLQKPTRISQHILTQCSIAVLACYFIFVGRQYVLYAYIISIPISAKEGMHLIACKTTEMTKD